MKRTQIIWVDTASWLPRVQALHPRNLKCEKVYLKMYLKVVVKCVGPAAGLPRFKFSIHHFYISGK